MITAWCSVALSHLLNSLDDQNVRLWSFHLCYRWPKSPEITVWRSSPNLSRLPITRNRDFWELMVCTFKAADVVKSHVSTVRLSLIPWKRFQLPLNVLMWSKLKSKANPNPKLTLTLWLQGLPTTCAAQQLISSTLIITTWTRTWTNHYATISLPPHTTPTWQVTSWCHSPGWTCTPGCCRLAAAVSKVRGHAHSVSSI